MKRHKSQRCQVFPSRTGTHAFKERNGCGGRTKKTIGFGLATLCAAILLLTYGNYLGESTAT